MALSFSALVRKLPVAVSRFCDSAPSSSLFSLESVAAPPPNFRSRRASLIIHKSFDYTQISALNSLPLGFLPLGFTEEELRAGVGRLELKLYGELTAEFLLVKTDDDNPEIGYNRGTVGGRVAGNERSFLLSAPFQISQMDMEYEIHNLEQIAYDAVLRAFKAQSDALTWVYSATCLSIIRGLITELRKELRVSDDEHRELLSQVNGDDLIRRIREWREAGGNRNIAPSVAQHINNQLPSPTISASRNMLSTFGID
ncbi:hypothetical protein SASPL_118247 [Salvia splendens]|uniref:ENT domain-containing protein n=1 Tax=Salvia splendens TaxID=180675 RepID=A0A8X8XXC9_SALSN|nr:hypothetical protein SASPL_118247 [Salvia splendens]